MDIPYIKGIVSKQAHVAVPDGTFEEEVGRNGFFGKYAHIYRTHSPVGWTRIEGPLKPQAFDLRRMRQGMYGTTGDYLSAKRLFLYNDDVRLSFCHLQKPMPYFFRNADSDEVLFVHQGSGRLETDYGPLNYESGDYLQIPRGTVYRIDPQIPSEFLVIESMSEIHFPEKGMLGQHALFDPAVVSVPTPEGVEMSNLGRQSEYEVRIQRCSEITKVFYPFCPLDTVGWKGTLTVQQLNVRDIRPVLSDRYHLPPSAHTTFVAQNFVVCTFVPRPLEIGDEKAMRVPFYHSNVDFDEAIFYHSGEFFSRSGIEEGMVTFHPQGIHHGPHKKAVERSVSAQRTNEVAVMVDTKRPMKVAQTATEVELKEYWRSWQ